MSGETPLVISCGEERLAAVLHAGRPDATVGVVIVVGGPQYRVGAHRQFVMMARRMAAGGFPVLRFDCRGMGDSEGEPRSFEQLDEDVRAALDCFASEAPSVTKLILLGLCDAASASLMYVERDDRVTGLVLLNPWARTEQGEAQSYLRHYYLQRLFQRSFWAKVMSGRFNPFQSARQLGSTLSTARKGGTDGEQGGSEREINFIDRMLAGFAAFSGPVLMLISGKDLTAQEFVDLTTRVRQWRRLIRRENVRLTELGQADHTLSRQEDLDRACHSIVRWLGDLGGNVSAQEPDRQA